MQSHENTPNTNNANIGTANTEPSETEIVHSVEKLPKPVYYVEPPDDNTVLVGIDVTIEHYKRGEDVTSVVDWYDTSHDRRMLASEIDRKDDYFAFRRTEKEGGGIYYFAPMNLDIYNSKVKHRLISSKDFANNEDLIKAFLETTKNGF